MEIHELTNDGEAESETSVPARERAFTLTERIEDIGEERRIDARSGIAHGQQGVALAGHQLHHDASAA